MNIITKLSALIFSVLMLSSCGDSSSPQNSENTSADTSQVTETEETAEESTEATETKAPETEEEFHNAMIDRSVLSTGNNYRLKKAAKKLKNNEKTNICYLGGSITEGVGGTPSTCWAKLSFDKICERYGNTSSEYFNKGLSGTPSILGNIRAERDILANDPDIVFIEFAVNDGQDALHKESYESLVKTVLTESETAVILVINRLENGYTCQQHMSQIGEHYGLPVISVNDAITPEFDEGRMTWKDYSNDGSHPNEYGHSLVAEMVDKLFEVTDSADTDEPFEINETPLFGTGYTHMTLVTPDNLNAEGFELISTGAFTETNATVSGGFETAYANTGSGESMKLKVNANSFFVVYKRNKSGDMGSIDVYLNGSRLTTVNANDNDGWGDPYSAQIIKFSSVKDMEIEIKMSEGSEEKPFEIVGFAFSQNG